MKMQLCTETRQSLKDKVEREVRLRTGGRIRGLCVDVEDGRVVLSGRTGTYYTKQLATHAVLETVEDMLLSNDIEVC